MCDYWNCDHILHRDSGFTSENSALVSPSQSSFPAVCVSLFCPLCLLLFPLSLQPRGGHCHWALPSWIRCHLVKPYPPTCSCAKHLPLWLFYTHHWCFNWVQIPHKPYKQNRSNTSLTSLINPQLQTCFLLPVTLAILWNIFWNHIIYRSKVF